ncbi:hypothetical protein KUCAC02_020458, partial [Chaenocephalus aceratus]
APGLTGNIPPLVVDALCDAYSKLEAYRSGILNFKSSKAVVSASKEHCLANLCARNSTNEPGPQI